MIQNISIENLTPHQQNPRQDLGDLTELAESIKASGVMQNLTVIQQKPGYCPSCEIYKGSTEEFNEEKRPACSAWCSKGIYTVVIGHRRLAAAKLAGLTELPCAIVEMDEKTQIATMLLENMQRSDLTAYEQARGFQMMLDLGETVSTITEKTGFSETTVRKRVKLLDLNKKEFQDAQSRGATLMDFMRLNEIEDLKERNTVLEKLGTENFEWEFKKAINNQKEKKNIPLILIVLKSFAKQIKESEISKYEYVKHISSLADPETIKPKDSNKVEYFYSKTSWAMTLYKKKSKKEINKRPAEEIEKERQIKDTLEQLKELTKSAYELRKEFMLSVNVKKYSEALIGFVGRINMLDHAIYICSGDREIYELAVTPNELPKYGVTAEDIKKACAANPRKTALLSTWAKASDLPTFGYFRNRYSEFPCHQGNVALDLIYDFLEEIGYQMSDEEKALQNGTHELMNKGQNEKHAEVIEETEDEEESISETELQLQQ